MNLLRRPQRLLILAFALSLLLHLIFALVVRMSQGSTQNEVESVTIEHREAIMRLQTPPPRPKVTPVPHPRPKVRPAPAATHGAQPANTGTGGVAAAPSAAPTPQPTAVAVASAAPCAKSNADAAVIGDPPPPDVPNAARAQATSGIALIRIQLDASGDVTGAEISRSTGNSSLDLVAMEMARGARYAPATHDCKPVPGEYTYSVKFAAW
jgi:periplasmic protein TonB